MAFEPTLPWSRTWRNLRARALWRLWLPGTLRRAAAVLTDSEFCKRRMIELFGADPQRVRVLPLGVGPEFFVPAEAPPPTGEPYLITVGGLNVRKGGAELVAVAHALKARNHPLRIVVVGGVDPQLEAAARAVGNIDLVGRLPDAEMRARLCGATALLFLSHYAGIVVDITDTQAAADAAVQLANSAAERKTWADRGADRAEKFTWAVAAATLEAHLREIA
jgi:glycosyltransferase involved in cell wall biosynthesis